jgi:pSer/pThr/pTyr-binding forkhead associated (FHA) protein
MKRTMVSTVPPAAPAYLISLLAKRFAAVGDTVAQSWPGWWVVWEPGPCSTTGIFDPTRTPKGLGRSGSTSDSLSFHLKSRQALTVGRSAGCDIVITDATVSREHLAFEPDGEGWKVRVLSSGGSTEVAGIEHRVGSEVPLKSGAVLRLGDVALTFWHTEGLVHRLKAM